LKHQRKSNADDDLCNQIHSTLRLPPPASLRAGLRSAARLSAPGPRATLVTAHATRSMLLNNPARFRERANIVQVSSLRRHRSQNVGNGHGFCIFAASSAPALWQLPSGKASARCAHPRPRHRNLLPYLSASSSPARSAPVRITPLCY